MSNAMILKKYLGEYLRLAMNDEWEKSINDMPGPIAFEFTKCYIQQMFNAMSDYELVEVKYRLHQAEKEMK